MSLNEGHVRGAGKMSKASCEPPVCLEHRPGSNQSTSGLKIPGLGGGKKW